MENAGPFRLTVAANRRIPFKGEPTRTLPEWGGALHAPGRTFILHPPVDFEIAYRVDEVVLLVAYSPGVCSLSVQDGPAREVRLRAGSLCFFPPRFCVRARQPEPLEFLVLALAEPQFREAVGPGLSERWRRRHLTNLLDAGLAAIGGEIRRTLLADPRPDPAYLGSLADALAGRVGRLHLAEAPAARGGEKLAPFRLHRVLSEIEEGLDGTLRVEALARVAGVSLSHFIRAFHETMGDPPQRFILKRRVAKARQLIGEARGSLSAIAMASGFSSQAHMCTAFRKILGVSPGRYRDVLHPAR